jgi:hypothetical protein
MNENILNRCNICFEEEIPNNRKNLLTNCNHSFCKKCLENWFLHKTNCPVCRHEFELKDIYNFKSNFRFTRKEIYNIKSIVFIKKINLMNQKIEYFNKLIKDNDDNELIKVRYAIEINKINNRIIDLLNSNFWFVLGNEMKNDLKKHILSYYKQINLRMEPDIFTFQGRQLLFKLGIEI